MSSQIVNELFQHYQGGRLAQVYLLYGNYQHIAQDLAVEVLSDSTKMSRDVVRKHIASNTFPNFYQLTALTKETRPITVEVVRELSVFLQDTPVLPGWRVVVVQPADALNVSASNALLKNMEEMPRNTTMLLLADSLYSISATILSRAQKIFIPHRDVAMQTRLSEDVGAQKVWAVAEEALRSGSVPALQVVDELVASVSVPTVVDAVTCLLWRRAMADVPNARVWCRKYDQVADFVSEIDEDTLTPAHTVVAVLNCLVR
ncbi:MAG: hypothetical protein LBR89_04675 [Holosporales bacterium]|jgi:hypothetical protein|nr:hypothetical protein [Holosporales bacterium]